MTDLVQDYRDWVEKQKVKRDDLGRRMGDTERSVEEKKGHAFRLVKARWVINEVARLTQNRFRKRVEDLVTLAVRSVMDQPLRFLVEFDVRGRGRSECHLRLQDGDSDPFVPKEEQGGMIVNLIGFALNIVLLSLQRPRLRKLLVLDEPFPFSGKGETLRRVGAMLRETSHSLGFQMIIVTHEPELAEMADRAWEVSHDGVHSVVSLMDGDRRESARVVKRIGSVPRSEKRKALEL